MKQIIHAVHIHAAPSDVFQALTTAEGLRRWWTTQVQAEEREGGVISFTFTGDFNPRMKQTRLDLDLRVEWLCVAGHSNWQDNTFSFALEERKGETLLMFSQGYARELSDEVYGTYNFNWGYYLNSLKLLCEKGAGVPFTPPPSA
jgi:Activator of Hsp90 ATPase homolog 1-like protein